jgi:hypothetical protein
MALQDRLEVLKTLPPEKLRARLPAWYKTHERNCRGADCLAPIPALNPKPVYPKRWITVQKPDDDRPQVFKELNRIAGPGDLSTMPVHEYVKAFCRAAQLKGA